MDWLADDLERGQRVLTIGIFVITGILVLIGRKKLIIAVPCACVFLLLAAMAIPSFIPARNVAYRNACINNLRQIETAKAAWAEANHKSATDIPTMDDLCGTNNFLRFIPTCQKGGIYSLKAVGQKPVCSLANKGHKLE